MTGADLPALNAALNATSAVLIVLGFLAIRRKQVLMHQRCMIAAVIVSGLFLASYLYYHFAVRASPTSLTAAGLGCCISSCLTHTYCWRSLLYHWS